ncbi:MAG: DMT family transporter [Pseudomonadota bacterium]|nr:DMT family transporter [Pseudomonadota bacterium]
MFAILLTLMGGGVLAVMDAISKELTNSLPVIQVVWSRYFFHAIIVIIYLFLLHPRTVFISKQPKIQLQRSFLLFIATLAMYTSLKYLPLADAAAVQFFAPVLVTILSSVFLKEKIGIRRYLAVIAAFFGVLIIIQPGFDFRWATLLPLSTAFLLAIFLIQTKKLQKHDSAYTTLFYTTLVGVIILLLIVPFNWRQPEMRELILMCFQGGLGAAGHLAIIKGLQYATASFLSPFLYSQLLVAVVLSFVFLGDPLTIEVIVGAGLIVISGVYIWYREVYIQEKN